MKNDYAKSILDSPYNRVEDGKKIELLDILSKYRYQHQNRQLTTYVAYAEDIGITKKEDLAYQNWINDGNPTGIESDESSMNFSGWLMERPLWSYGGYDLTP